jgi:hypothetical protein
VCACRITCGIGEVCFRSLKQPSRSGGTLLTDVDLDPFAGNGEDGVLRRWWLGLGLGYCDGGKAKTER